MKLTAYNQTIPGQDLQMVSHQGKDHWILPVIMMVEGVHSGSGGPLLYTAEELGKFASAWDGTAVVINHPSSEDGTPISANNPDGVGQVVGRLFNTRMEGVKLKSEAWVDIDTLEQVSPEAYTYIKDEKALEVSIGVYSEEVNKQGVFNNEEYRAVAQNLRPDHLALLPGAVGACSWDDGCGVRTNKQKDNEVKNLKTLSSKELLEEGVSIHLISNEAGYREVIRTIQRMLDLLDSNGRYYYLDEIYETYIVYRVETSETQDTSYYRRDYAAQEDGTIEFTTAPVQVRKEVTFVVMESGKLKRTNFNNNHKSEKNMKNSKCCPEKVAALIANTASRFTDEDKEWLSTFDEKQLESMFPVEAKKPEVNANEETKKEDAKKSSASDEAGPVINRAELEKTVKSIFNEAKDPNEFIDSFMPEGMKGQMKSGLKMYHEKRSQLIAGIVSNSSFEAEALKAWEDNDLQKLHDSVAPGTDFSVNGESNFSANASQGAENGMESMLNFPSKETK